MLAENAKIFSLLFCCSTLILILYGIHECRLLLLLLLLLDDDDDDVDDDELYGNEQQEEEEARSQSYLGISKILFFSFCCFAFSFYFLTFDIFKVMMMLMLMY